MRIGNYSLNLSKESSIARRTLILSRLETRQDGGFKEVLKATATLHAEDLGDLISFLDPQDDHCALSVGAIWFEKCGTTIHLRDKEEGPFDFDVVMTEGHTRVLYEALKTLCYKHLNLSLL